MGRGRKYRPTIEGYELKDLRGKNIHLQTHHKRTARLLLSLCALDVYLQYVCRVDGKQAISVLRRLFLSSMFDRLDGSKPARGSLLKIEGILPTAAKNSILSASRLRGYVCFRYPFIVPCLAVWNFQNAENVRVESVNRHRAYFPLVRLFQTLKNAAKV